jgi:putative oxidoreductase
MMTNDGTWRQRAARLAFRVMLSGIFLIAGTNHLFRTGAITGRLEKAPYGDLVTMLAPPQFLVLAAGVALLIGGFALMTGFATRWAAAGLIAVIIPITLVVQTAGLSTLGPLFKNIGLTGGLIYFAVHGARSWSLDELLDGEGTGGAARAAG